MKNLEAHFKEIKKQYPKTMSKDQLYRVAHISKATALYLLQSGAIPCKDTGKKTRRYGRAAPCIGWCTKEVMRAAGLPKERDRSHV